MDGFLKQGPGVRRPFSSESELLRGGIAGTIVVERAAMSRTITVRGRLVGSTTVEVDRPVPPETIGIEVVIHLSEQPSSRGMTVAEYVRTLPPGSRTKEDIDRQISEERDSWRD